MSRHLNTIVIMMIMVMMISIIYFNCAVPGAMQKIICNRQQNHHNTKIGVTLFAERGCHNFTISKRECSLEVILRGTEWWFH